MILKKVQVRAGNLDYLTNCYVVIDENSKRAMVVDPGGESEKILDVLKYNNATLDYIVLTHGHGDHIGALNALKQQSDAKVCIYYTEAEFLKDNNLNLADYVGIQNPNMNPEICLKENDILTIGSINFKVIHTPGHTFGSICLYNAKEKILISGDTIFRGAWGRTDLPTSSFEDIIKSIEEKIMVLPDDVIVYPGHGKTTMIKDERHIYLDLG